MPQGDPSKAVRETLAVFESAPAGTPMATTEITDELDVGRRATYNRLQQLVDADLLETKQVGSRGRVWWRPPDADGASGTAGAGDTPPGLDEVFSRIDHAFLAIDTDWTITYLNENAAMLVEGTRDELVGECVWDVITEAEGERPQQLAERAMAEQESVEFYYHSDVLECWFEASIFPDETGLSVYFRDVTAEKERERELEQYATIVETIDDGVYVVDPTGEIVFVNDAYADMTGFDRDTLVGMDALTLVDEATVERARTFENQLRSGERDTATLEADVNTADGDTFRGEATFSMVDLPDGQTVRIGVVRDISDRKRRERELERQRERLGALNDLNQVVHDTIDAVLDQSTREQVEDAVCHALADSDSYTGAWIGAVDARDRTIQVTASAGVDVEGPVSTDPADHPESPTVHAVHDRTIQVSRTGAPDETTVAIPIEHEETLYGVLTINTDRVDAVTADEAEVIDQLGDVVGHAIAAIQRKRALLSEEVVELDFAIEGLGSEFGATNADGRLSIDRLVPANDGIYVAHGTATGETTTILDGFVDALPHWQSVSILDESADWVRFEAQLVEPPVLSTVTELGGYVDSAIIEDGDYHMRIHLAPGADTRPVIDAVTAAYPDAQLVTRRQHSRTNPVAGKYAALLGDVLTPRQRTVLDAAFSAGYFETPRKRSGEQVAESLGIAAPTFHQHLRKAQQQLLEAVLATPTRER